MKLNFVAIDFETADVERSSICEIGLAVVRDSEIVEKTSFLVRPTGNYYNPRNISIHGITPEITKNSPSFAEIWPKLAPYLEDRLVIAHNAAFDMYALHDALKLAHVDMPHFDYCCSLVACRAFVKAEHHRLNDMAQHFGVDQGTHHRAGDDAATCAEIFIGLVDTLDVRTDKQFRRKLNRCYYSFPKQIEDSEAYRSHNRRSAPLDARLLERDNDAVDIDSPLYGKSVCITGSPYSGNKKVLLQALLNIGGTPVNSVTRTTDYLVVAGCADLEVDYSEKSAKWKKAEELVSKGFNLQILSELDLLNILGRDDLIEEFKMVAAQQKELLEYDSHYRFLG